MIEYAKAMGANDEVLGWCETVLAARERKQGLDVGECEHIIDYLTSDAAPKRLRRMSYAQAKDGADRWSKANQKRGAHLVDGPEDLEVLHDFGDGTKIVKLLTKRAYQREGFFMSHCLGGYDPAKSTAYSYRDADNYPHATFEVTRDGEEITQIKGKGNGPIHPKYIEPILTFLQAIGKEIRPYDMRNLGYYHVTDDTKQMLDQFQDSKGRGPQYVEVRGEEYLCVS